MSFFSVEIFLFVLILVSGLGGSGRFREGVDFFWEGGLGFGIRRLEVF